MVEHHTKLNMTIAGVPTADRKGRPGASFAELPYRVMPRLNIAIVAPSMGILGGQAVQASRLVRSWRDDREIHAWLVPINPTPPGPLRAAGSEVPRTVVTHW